jgi:DNA end-binding protein Ku
MPSTIWKGHLTFGLVSVPIKLLRAARAEKVHMHLLQRETGARVRRVFVPQEEDVVPEAQPQPQPEPQPVTPKATAPPPLPSTDLIRGFEYEKDKYIEFEPRELEALATRNSTEMQIVEFVKLAEVDPVYLENSYYIAPDKQGEKPYALLFDALRQTGQCAVAEFVLHRRDQIILLRAGRHGIVGHTLFHDDEVRKETEFRADSTLVIPRERDLAIKLIEALAAPFEPEKFKDKYRDRLNAAISEKLANTTTAEAKPAKAPAQVVDILEALRASLTQAKKPAASETQNKRKRSAGGK